MLYLINYANKKYRRAQILNSKTAKKIGGFDIVIEYSDKDIDENFKNKNKHILEYKKGNGYWLWKSYIINKTLKNIEYGDYLMYCDSGAYFINNVESMIKCMNRDNQDLMCFEIPTIEKNWSKRDAFVLMDCDSKKYTDTKQREGGFVLIKKTKKTEEVISQWLEYAQDARIITDEPNTCGKSNYSGFIENRHDQTIFSLLTKKYGYIAYRDPAIPKNNIYSNSDYDQIVELHRYGFCKTKLQVKISRILINKILRKFYTPKKK